MLRRSVIVPLALLAAGAAIWAAAATHAQGPGPTAGEALATGLLAPRGMAIGPDGMIYVAEAGSGGTTVVTVEGSETTVGETGRISRIDPDTGERTTVVDGLPSNNGPEGDAVGPAGVAFIGDTLYYLQTHGGEAYGFPDTPTGIYRVNDDGSTDLIADIGQFNLDNVVSDITSGVQLDIEPGGNPYAIAVRGGAFYVTDGNQNQLMKVTTSGDITRITEFPGHPVTTGIATHETGPMYVSQFGAFPFADDAGIVERVGIPSGLTNEVASGYGSITDVEFGPGGHLYALTFGVQATSPDAPAPWDLFTARILRVNDDGTMTTIVDGLNLASALIFDGDTAYVANNTVTVPGVFEGEIWKIENFSSITPAPQPAPTAPPAPAPAATPTRTTGITAPDTGSGPSGADDSTPGLALAAVVITLSGGVGLVLAARRVSR